MTLRYPAQPFEIEIQLSARCNLSCGHCFGSFSADSPHEMSWPQVRAILDDMAAREIPRVTFSGGEPLLYPDLDRGIAYAAELNLETRLLTNGSLATPATARRLREIGLESVGISIDGNEEDHDGNRGQGRYRKALEAIGWFRSAELHSVSVNLLVHADNYRHLDAVVGALLGAGAHYVVCLPLQLFGRARARMQDKTLSPSQMYELYQRFERDSRKDHRNIFIHGPLGVLMDPPPQSDLHLDSWEPCQAGHTRLSISANGDCHPCIPLDVPLGNYFRDGLDKVWHGSTFLKQIREPSALSRDCQRCEYLSRCVGGCRVAAYYAHGTPLERDPQCFKAVMRSGREPNAPNQERSSS